MVNRVTARASTVQRRSGYALHPIIVGTVAILIGATIWEISAHLFFQPFELPPLSKVAVEGLSLLSSGDKILGATLPMHIVASMYRIVVGLLVGSLLGVTIALAMGSVAVIHRFLDPIVNFFRFIPPIAWISPFLIWFGIGKFSKIALIVYTVSFMVLLNTLAGIFAVHHNKLRVAQCMGASRWQIFRWVVIPASVRFMLDGMRIAIGNAFVTVVGAEMIAAEMGLGYLILVSRNFGGTDIIFLAMVIFGVLGFGTDRLFVYLSGNYARRFYFG